MCLIAFVFAVPGGPLLRLASNRDEFHSRPSDAAHWWTDAPAVFGGRDRLAGGTWLAASRSGRVAAITNHRSGLPAKAPRSRGALVADFVRGDEPIAAYARRIAGEAAEYGGFNLLLFDFAGAPAAWVVDDVGDATALAPGLYGLSNHRIETPWPKVLRLKRRLAQTLAEPADSPGPDERLFDALRDRTIPAPHELPDSGVGIARERYLSPAFIAPGPGEDGIGGYGTRASTLVDIADDGQVRFTERTWRQPRAPDAGYEQRDERFALDRR